VAKGRFRFNFTKAVQAQFEQQLNSQPQRPLAEPQAPNEPGVYLLYRSRKIVYVGSAVGGRKLANRLREHARKIGGRQNISLDEMTCRFLPVDEDWMAAAAEEMMIARYDPPWQGSGFGGHLPGRGRPGVRVSLWDEQFPPKKNT
jgi:hypothetical protein